MSEKHATQTLNTLALSLCSGIVLGVILNHIVLGLCLGLVLDVVLTRRYRANAA